MRVPKIVASLMLGVGLLGGQMPAEAKGPGTESSALQMHIDQMTRQGWTVLQPGVLQRMTSSGTMERFTYGEDGLRFSIQEATNRFGELIRAYHANPTTDGAKAAEAQAGEVKRLHLALDAIKKTDTTRNLEVFLNSGCSFSFSYNADAAYLTTSQGVTSSASASFTNNCGYVGNVYAHAFAQGSVGNTFTSTFQKDPLTGTTNGTNVSVAASRTLAATSQCYSSAEAGVYVAALGLNLTANAANSVCPIPPVPPLTVSISGLLYHYLSGFNCTSVTWTASVSGGTPGYTYAWTIDGYPVGTGSTYSTYLCGNGSNYTENFTLAVTVTDSASRTGSDTEIATVQHSGGCDPWHNYPYEQLCPYY